MSEEISVIQLDVPRHQTIRLALDFADDMSGHTVEAIDLFKIDVATTAWIDQVAGTAELVVPSSETTTWPFGSRHRLSLKTTAPNGGDVENWGTVEFKVHEK